MRRSTLRAVLSSRPGNGTSSTSSTFLYHFEHKLALTDVIEAAKKKPYGVFHGSELPLVFRIDETLLEKAERALAVQVESFWTQFAKSGKPADEAAWPAYTTANDLSLRLKTGSAPTAHPGLKHDVCNFWDKFEPSVPP